MSFAGCDCGSEHEPYPKRAWCMGCHEYCYPDSICEVQELRNFKAQITDIVSRMAVQEPDGGQEDYELWEDLYDAVLRPR